ncbi:hypothetical protein [Glaciecola sp. SC05]|uniref:hypothetical protein n=1 Tax=Glaciecola sp. SC05 TaxID=1987355 RepID=UPI003527E842
MSKGSRVKAQKQAQTAAEQQAESAKLAQESDKQASAPKYTAFTNPKNINWVLLSGAMALTVVVLMFMPQQLGDGITSVYSIMLWMGMFSATVFRYVGKNGWIGFFVGSFIGMLLNIFAPLIKTLF